MCGQDPQPLWGWTTQRRGAVCLKAGATGEKLSVTGVQAESNMASLSPAEDDLKLQDSLQGPQWSVRFDFSDPCHEEACFKWALNACTSEKARNKLFLRPLSRLPHEHVGTLTLTEPMQDFNCF